MVRSRRPHALQRSWLDRDVRDAAGEHGQNRHSDQGRLAAWTALLRALPQSRHPCRVVPSVYRCQSSRRRLGLREVSSERVIEVYARVHGGITARLAAAAQSGSLKASRVLLDGPYGGFEGNIKAYDRVLLLGGGSGTYSVPFGEEA